MPRRDVLLAAEQHDVGMAAWDAAPDRNPETGRPYSFLEMPLETHVRLWSNAGRLARTQSRYAGLLTSLHGTTLYGRRDLDALPAAQAELVRGYLERERAFQAELIASLRDDPRTAPHATDDAVDRNRRLIFAWDWMSLVLCLDRERATVPDVPTAGGDGATLAVARGPKPADPAAPIPVTVDPWPFAPAAVEVRCEGRRLEGRHDGVEAMRAALDRAPWAELSFALAPPPPTG